MQFNSTGFDGDITKAVTVTCNDPQKGTIVLTMKGSVWKPLEVTPGIVVFQLATGNQSSETKSVRIINNAEEPLTVSDLQCANAAFTAALKTVRPGKEFEIQITTVPPFSLPTTIATVTARTSSAKMPAISVKAFALVQQEIVVHPDRFRLPAGPLKTATELSVSVRNNSTNPLVLSEPASSASGVEVKVQETVPGKSFSVIATFPQGYAGKPGETVKVKSNHPGRPLLEIPVVEATAPAPVPPSSGSAQ